MQEVLSTLAHEMVHQWQAYYGSPSRSAYHNKEWADKMESIGLMPSDTGKPGGKRTGQQMTHYIITGGLFEQACSSLLSDGFRLAWGEITDDLGDDDLTTKPGGGGKGKTTRVKFTCPRCQANAWGKPSLKLICGDCLVVMETE